ncbi:SCO3242 family prenyltransferase [Spirillospora sp. NPDC047279]|uniref:SCO3242 family prenyltransferase n=1 Tax=Spirillospora sp. NPDC047279 TaxID=3155478 RepID=UPI0033CFFA58
MTVPDLRTIAVLVRAPAALTVPGDVLAGTAASGRPFGLRPAGLAAGSVCLYWAGMALNDYADRELDRVERPERPIPSGRVTPGFALALATGLTAAGVAASAAVAGRRALTITVPLAGTVWAYDLALKDTPLGPFAMAAARALNVLAGTGGHRPGAALPEALTVGLHILGVTGLSRGEVEGMGREVPLAVLAGTALVSAAAVRGGRRDLPRGRRVLTAALATGYAVAVGGPQAAAVRESTAGRIRRAVGAGILGLVPLQAALAARGGSCAGAVTVAAAYPVARHLARRAAVT